METKLFIIEKALKDIFELIEDKDGRIIECYSPKLSAIANVEVHLYLAASDDLCVTCVGWGFEESYNLGSPTVQEVVDFLRRNYIN